MKFNRITLARIGNNETIRYAVEELYTYLKKIDNTLFVDVRFYPEYDENVKNVIWVGQSEAFTDKLLEVEDTFLDDSIYIDVENSEGIITGCNPRAVLIAAYRFLKELGVAWIRPTDDGEVVPEYKITALNAFVQEKPSYRHRAICIEGSVAYEHILEMLKWIPRAGMSGYFIQFFRPYYFFDNWYSHQTCPEYFENENVSRADVDAITREVEAEVKKRGLVYHKVGHGWTAEPLGFVSDGWSCVKPEEIPEETKEYLPLLDGIRRFWRDIPINTQLCYSNPKVRKIMVDCAVNYIKNNPHVDILHFWLADWSNNVCECENCKELPSDYYLMMLNEIDEILTREGINTKIVFLVCGPTFWAPLKEKIKNSKRFIMEFAPITRNFSRGWKEIDPKKKYTHIPYVLNNVHQPKEVEDSFAHLAEWQEVHKEDSFDFDYHLMWDHKYDPGYYQTAKLLFEDMQALEVIGLNGMMSCQHTRASFPSNLPMHVMAEVLWDKECDFTEKALEYYLTAFGPDGEAVMEYMKELSENFGPAYSRHLFREKTALYSDEERMAKLKKCQALLAGFKSTVERNLSADHPDAIRASWEYLSLHAEYCQMLLKPLIAKAKGNKEEKDIAVAEFKDFAKLLAVRAHKVFDDWLADDMVNRMTYME